jgi:hypothetical protein
MKKLAITALGVLTLAASANAQGTWYTNQALWLSRTTVTSTADYNAFPSGFSTSPYTENGVTATSTDQFVGYGDGTLTTKAKPNPITFSFTGNAFGGMFGMRTNTLQADGMNFSVDGSLTNIQSLTSATTGYTFLGYISDSSSPISVKFSGDSTPQLASVDSFSFGNGTNPSAPGGAVPEPGTVVSMGLLGAGVLGLVIRSRRRMSN